MAKIPEVAQPIQEVPEYDGRSLDLILNIYNVEQTPRLGINLFRSRYLPLLAKRHPRPEDNDAVRRMWVEEVSRTYRLPVFITDDLNPDNIIYRVPPLTGTVNTRLTGHAGSMASMDKQEEALKGRLSTQGLRFRAQKFDSFEAHDHVNRNYQADWINIMVNEGYLQELYDTIGPGPYPDYIAAIVGNRLDNISDTPKPTADWVTGKPTTTTIGLLDEDEQYADD